MPAITKIFVPTSFFALTLWVKKKNMKELRESKSSQLHIQNLLLAWCNQFDG